MVLFQQGSYMENYRLPYNIYDTGWLYVPIKASSRSGDQIVNFLASIVSPYFVIASVTYILLQKETPFKVSSLAPLLATETKTHTNI